MRSREARTGWLLAAPAASIVGLLFAVPLALVVWMSLSRWPIIGDPKFNGLANYRSVSADVVLSALWFTVQYTVLTTVILLVVGLGLALFVQPPRPCAALLRAAYFLPAAVGLATASLLWFSLYSNELGPLDDILRAVGIVDGRVNWLGTPDNALWSVILMITWRFAGLQMIILLTGLQAIPTEVYEAAKVDGAGWWQSLVRITLPQLRPTLALVLTLSVTGSVLAFEQFYLMTAGGPDNATVTLVMVIFRQAFTLFDLGVAAALSVVVLVALVVSNVVQISVLKRGD